MNYYRSAIRLILILAITTLSFFGKVLPVFAQPVAPSLSESEISQIQDIAQKAFAATNTGEFAKAEKYWSEIIEQFPESAAALSNRGNVRVGQNKLKAALADYNKAIELVPHATDPYLNRGTAYEGLGEWEKAIADYNYILELDPNDAMAYNNRGNAFAGLGKWENAIADYQKAFELNSNFALARANYAVTLYQIGETKEAIRTLKNLTRKYPQFPDVRAALTAALWDTGKRGEAESNWVAVVGLDGRYKDINWVKTVRRWPPVMVDALDKFLTLQ